VSAHGIVRLLTAHCCSSRSLAVVVVGERASEVRVCARHMLSIIFSSFGLPFCDSFPILLHIVVVMYVKEEKNSTQHINIQFICCSCLCDVSFFCTDPGFFRGAPTL
jgi:hypothetical protein